MNEVIVLSKMEKQVLIKICNGFTRTEISSELGISSRTVKYYTDKLFERFEVRNKTLLAVKAYVSGYIKSDQLDISSYKKTS